MRFLLIEKNPTHVSGSIIDTPRLSASAAVALIYSIKHRSLHIMTPRLKQ